MQSYIFHDSVELHFFLCVLGQSQLNTLLLSVDKHVRNLLTTRWAAAPSSCLKVTKNETSTRTLWAALAEELYQYRKRNNQVIVWKKKKKYCFHLNDLKASAHLTGALLVKLFMLTAPLLGQLQPIMKSDRLLSHAVTKKTSIFETMTHGPGFVSALTHVAQQNKRLSERAEG